MKKLYAGIGISVAVIIFGIVTTQKFTPKVDMASLGGYYYNYKKMAYQSVSKVKVISGDEKSLKLTVEFNDFNGYTPVSSIINDSFYNKSTSKEEKEMIGKYLTEKPNFNIEEYKDKPLNSENTKLIGEEIKYKWVKKPDNMALSIEEAKEYKSKKSDNYTYGEVSKPVIENNKIPESGSLKLLKNKEGRKGSLDVHGIKGNGILELEINAIYAQEG